MIASLTRLLLGACLAAMVLAPAHAQTRKPAAQETKTIRACFEEKGETEKGAQCIGLVATRCAKKPENQGGLSRADCYRIEQEIWDVLLNETNKELQVDLDEEQKTKLRDMQRAWMASRDATCEFYHHKIQGSMAVPMSASCFLNETARRALLLKQMSGV
jgi:uncharacterized protein YecT (DUF1311 family)